MCVSGIGFVSVSTILIGRKNCSDVWYFSLDVRTVLTCGIFIGRKNCSDVWYFLFFLLFLQSVSYIYIIL